MAYCHEAVAVAYFGLRSALESTEPTESFVSARAKQSALLFDRVLFQAGSIALAVDGAHVDERRMRPARPGELARPQSVPEVNSAAGFCALLSYDGILESLRIHEAEWAGVVAPTTGCADNGEVPDWPDWLQWALAGDVRAASGIHAVAVTSAFMAPRAEASEESRLAAQGVVSPDVSYLSWEQIVRLREHGSIRAARRLLHEALELRFTDGDAMLSTIDVLAQDVGDLVSAAVDEMTPCVPNLLVTRLAICGRSPSATPVMAIEAHRLARPGGFAGTSAS